MNHRMKLWHDSFVKIREGTKTVEMRLYDEKRSAINVDDAITFEDADSGETLTCSVLALHRYPSFAELYANHDKISIGYGEDETADPSDMLLYYSEEEIERYGAVGIELRVVNNETTRRDDLNTKKRGNNWTAYYDTETGRYFAEIMYTSREGREQYDYEITQDVYSRLGTFGDDIDNERLIKTAKLTYSFENTMYGTLGPERTVWDEEANEAMNDTVRRLRKEK